MVMIKKYFERRITKAFDKNEDFIRNKLAEFASALNSRMTEIGSCVTESLV